MFVAYCNASKLSAPSAAHSQPHFCRSPADWARWKTNDSGSETYPVLRVDTAGLGKRHNSSLRDFRPPTWGRWDLHPSCCVLGFPDPWIWDR